MVQATDRRATQRSLLRFRHKWEPAMKLTTAVLLMTAALPAAAASPLKSIPQSCTALRKDGWTAPADPFSGKKGQAEMNIPGVMYVCMIEHVLARAAGTGHPPDLQAFMSDDGKEPSIVLSAHIWCETDLPATLDALTKAFTPVNGAPMP